MREALRALHTYIVSESRAELDAQRLDFASAAKMRSKGMLEGRGMARVRRNEVGARICEICEE